MTAPETMPPDALAEFHRRRRGRNIAMLVVLLAVSGLFFAIAVVKMSRTGIG